MDNPGIVHDGSDLIHGCNASLTLPHKKTFKNSCKHAICEIKTKTIEDKDWRLSEFSNP